MAKAKGEGYVLNIDLNKAEIADWELIERWQDATMAERLAFIDKVADVDVRKWPMPMIVQVQDAVIEALRSLAADARGEGAAGGNSESG